MSLATRATKANTSGQSARFSQFDFWAVGILRSAVHFSQLTQLQLEYSATAPTRRPEVKLATLSVRLDPVIKAAAAAVLERRSVTGLLKLLIPQPLPNTGHQPRLSSQGIPKMTKTPQTARKRPAAKQAAEPAEIRFYRANEKPYGAFSNLYPRPIEFEGRTFPTSEHAYQAGKAQKPAVREWILSAPTPALAAMAAHGLYVWDVVPDWAKIKFDRMRAVLRAKFEQHADLKELLMSTGSARLVEAGTVNNAVNRLWGEVDGKGENMLGVMLMELRSAYALKPVSTGKAKLAVATKLAKSKKPAARQEPSAA